MIEYNETIIILTKQKLPGSSVEAGTEKMLQCAALKGSDLKVFPLGRKEDLPVPHLVFLYVAVIPHPYLMLICAGLLSG